MSETSTSADLVNKAAAILGKLIAGEALGQPEYDTIDGCIDNVLEEISSIVFIADRDEIPARFFNTIARLLAVHAAAEFSNVPLDLVQVTAHEDRLRYLAAGTTTYETLRTRYY
jgi:hypothetical protein